MTSPLRALVRTARARLAASLALPVAPAPPPERARPMPEPEDYTSAARFWNEAAEDFIRGAQILRTVRPYADLYPAQQDYLADLASRMRAADARSLLPVPEASPALAALARQMLALYPTCDLCQDRVALWIPVGAKFGSVILYCDQHKPSGHRTAPLPRSPLLRALDLALRGESPKAELPPEALPPAPVPTRSPSGGPTLGESLAEMTAALEGLVKEEAPGPHHPEPGQERG